MIVRILIAGRVCACMASHRGIAVCPGVACPLTSDPFVSTFVTQLPARWSPSVSINPKQKLP